MVLEETFGREKSSGTSEGRNLRRAEIKILSEDGEMETFITSGKTYLHKVGGDAESEESSCRLVVLFLELSIEASFSHALGSASCGFVSIGKTLGFWVLSCLTGSFEFLVCSEFEHLLFPQLYVVGCKPENMADTFGEAKDEIPGDDDHTPPVRSFVDIGSLGSHVFVMVSCRCPLRSCAPACSVVGVFRE
jgi:hypothetical protein